MSAFEQAIERIDSEISLKKEDRESYSKDYDLIRKHVLDIMCAQDSVFKHIYNGSSLFGSYLDNIKVEKPDEFDVHFVLKLPYNEKMAVKRDSSRPGFVNLDITHILSHIYKDPSVRFVYSTLEELVDKNAGCYLLNRNKLQDWIERIIKSALRNHSSGRVRSDDGRYTYNLSYSKCATAHTVKAYSPIRSISVDFVPAFKFTKNEAPFLERPFPSWVREKCWFAVPKPMIGDYNSRDVTFSICAPQIERDILRNKMNLKRSLRLLKSLRDKMGDPARKFKSYFIKSAYLLENDKRSDDFWTKPVGSLLLHMIDVLLGYLNAGSLPFYWDSQQNLFRSLKQDEVNKLRQLFGEVKQKLQRYSTQSSVHYFEIIGLFDKSPENVAKAAGSDF